MPPVMFICLDEVKVKWTANPAKRDVHWQKYLRHPFWTRPKQKKLVWTLASIKDRILAVGIGDVSKKKVKTPEKMRDGKIVETIVSKRCRRKAFIGFVYRQSCRTELGNVHHAIASCFQPRATVKKLRKYAMPSKLAFSLKNFKQKRLHPWPCYVSLLCRVLYLIFPHWFSLTYFFFFFILHFFIIKSFNQQPVETSVIRPTPQNL